jgi:hypothetical protein
MTGNRVDAERTNPARWAGTRPLWLTEWGCLNQSAPNVDTVVRFYRAALAAFPRVERYAVPMGRPTAG